MSVAEAYSALCRAIRARGGVCTPWEIRRELATYVEARATENPRVRMELWEPDEHKIYYRTKERRIRKLRSRKGTCLSCSKLVGECTCLATVAEYDSIEAGKIHITRKRLDNEVLERGYQADLRHFEEFASDYGKLWEAARNKMIAESEEPYWGEF